MQPFIYDVAVSIDGYIAGPDGDVSRFAHEGPVVDDYAARLATYGTAIMGRATYEFGYRYGMKPGQNPYPHMVTYVVSDTIDLPDGAEVAIIAGRAAVDRIKDIKRKADAPVYLVGGGALAAAMLRERLLDELIVKRAPIVLGSGTPLFSNIATAPQLECVSNKDYEVGYVMQRFTLRGA